MGAYFVPYITSTVAISIMFTTLFSTDYGAVNAALQSLAAWEPLSLIVPAENIDTDQITPARFLKVTKREGLGKILFADWRFDDAGNVKPDFVLNKPESEGCEVLVAGDNFGCGSSREHAPWAIQQYGFRAVIAPSFGDIFRNNCMQNGLLPVQLGERDVQTLMQRAQELTNYEVTIDLEAQEVRDSQGFSAKFEIDSFRKENLLQGLDDIGLTLQHESEIDAFEKARA